MFSAWRTGQHRGRSRNDSSSSRWLRRVVRSVDEYAKGVGVKPRTREGALWTGKNQTSHPHAPQHFSLARATEPSILSNSALLVTMMYCYYIHNQQKHSKEEKSNHKFGIEWHTGFTTKFYFPFCGFWLLSLLLVSILSAAACLPVRWCGHDFLPPVACVMLLTSYAQ